MSAPRLFVSYSHDSIEHKKWVFDLAWRLRAEFGIDVLLDVWDVNLGGDLPRFMEGIAQSDKVLMVCSSSYVGKCEEALGGGVAYEKMLVTPKILRDVYGNIVIPLIRNNDTAIMPVFIAGKRFIDFRDDTKYESLIRELAASIHGIEGVKPPVGLNPFRQGLDMGFGVNGRRVLDTNQLSPLRVSSSGEGVVAVGHQDNAVVIVNLHPNGDLDNGVNGTGVLRITGGELGAMSIADAIIVSDGVIVTPRQDVAGAPFAAKRISLNGAVQDFAAGFPVHAILADSPTSTFARADVIRLAILDSEGLPDGRFGDNGLMTLNLPAAFPLQWMRVKALNEAVYVYGMTRAHGNDDALLYKFLRDGTIDLSFGIDGCVNLSRLVWFLNVSDIERMPDGRLVIGGNGNEANIIRLTEDGRPDEAFGENAVVEFRASGRSTCEKVALFENSILIAGNASDGRSMNDVFVAKLMPDGRPDNSFHGEGFLALNIRNRDSLIDFSISGRTITLLCQSDCDAPRHFKTGLAKVHL